MGDLGDAAAEWLERMHAKPHPTMAQAGYSPSPLVPAEAVREARVRMFLESIDERFRSARLEHLAAPVDGGPPLPEATRDQIEDWVGWPEGRNLVLTGEVGTGKSYAAVAAVRERAVRGDRVWWLPAKALLALLRPDGDPLALHRACTVPVLALDDLGEERRTEWTAEQVDTVVEVRWNRELPIVATSNHRPGREGSLLEALGERAHSRLIGTGAVVLHLEGPDRRALRAKVPESRRPRGGPEQ